MRQPRHILIEAELCASSPERVFDWLVAKSPEVSAWSRDLYDEATAQALLARNDPLINLALARYSIFSKVVKQLFQSTDPKYGPALRVAALSNSVVGEVAFDAMPESLFGEGILNQGDVPASMKSLSNEELSALFSNPTISDDFLTSFLEQESSWQSLSEEQHLVALRALTTNPRIEREYSGIMDGFAEYSHSKVFDAAWLLADKVPTTTIWARVLGDLFGKLRAESFSIKEPLSMLARWQPTDAKQLEREAQDTESGWLGAYGLIRRNLTRLVFTCKNETAAFLSHEDPAVRACAYGEGILSVDQMQTAFDREPALAFQQMVWNENIWRIPSTREHLRELAWAGSRTDRANLDDANMFNAVRENMSKKHPDWFREEEIDSPTPQDSPATVMALENSSEKLAEAIRNTAQAQIGWLKGRFAWVLLGLVAVLAILLMR